MQSAVEKPERVNISKPALCKAAVLWLAAGMGTKRIPAAAACRNCQLHSHQR